MFASVIDIGDPFGGNGGLNQSFAEPGGPVQIFSPGYRNPYDVLISQAGHVFTLDNGANDGWGDLPLIYDRDGQRVDSMQPGYSAESGHWVSNELNEGGGARTDNPFHHVGNVNDVEGSYYGGHPRPIAAFPGKTDIVRYETIDGIFAETKRYSLSTLFNKVDGYFNKNLSIANLPSDSRQGLHWSVGENQKRFNILSIEPTSTNGLAEYTASNFNGALKGDVLAASFSGEVVRFKLDLKNSVAERSALFGGFGAVPLDVIAQGDNDVFPGTVWAATYGASSITVFEPKKVLNKSKLVSATSEHVGDQKMVPMLRINAGGTSHYSSDGGVPWLADSVTGLYRSEAFSVSAGQTSGFRLKHSGRHRSIPKTMSRTDYEAIFGSERWDDEAIPQLEYKLALENNSYTLNLYFGDGFRPVAKPGGRIFDIYIEDQLFRSDFDITKEFGTRAGGALSIPVKVIDGELNIRFGNKTQNPLVNGIEVLSPQASEVSKESERVVSTWRRGKEPQNYTSRHEASLVAAGNELISFGGREQPRKTEKLNLSALRARNTNVNSAAWKLGAQAPADFNHVQAVVYEGLVWVVAGFDNNDFPHERPTSNVFTYDAKQDRWQQRHSIPLERQRGAAGVAIYRDKIYVAGGNLAGHSGEFVSYFDAYDPKTGGWQRMPDMPRTRDHFQAVVVGDKFYAIGGRRTGGVEGYLGGLIAEVDVFDFKSGTWETLPRSVNLPSLRAGASTVVVDGKIIVIGGETQITPVATTELFDPVKRSWKILPNLINARHGMQAVVLQQTAYVLGGSPRRGRGSMKKMESLKLNHYGTSD